MITASMVKELRELTGAGMMNCKKALNEAEGNIERAVEILREKGLAAAAKKAGRVAAEGIVKTFITEDGKKAAIVEVNCETDFVAANEAFMAFADNIAKQVALNEYADIEELKAAKYIADEAMTVADALTALIAKLGENMDLRRFQKLSVENGAINSYIHGGGKIGVLVELESNTDKVEEVKALAREVAMQVAAANPLFLDRNSVDQEKIEKEREIYKVQALNEGKPEKIVDKMVEGRINKYLKEVCLVDQLWVKNGDLTISKLLEEEGKKLGAEISVKAFVRFEKGEGIEKKEENFAEEVQRQLSK
ncbi:translation elongation factor Ts [Oceanirhabdus sp. W0125-5]|uniref:translation elongation factor Ts n=1 Tax=Oceanirhabdus sp. W0125-5 TaxID=2999116 RepID=UPI0022F2CE3D|nr:translation elongation factor Ts [Oceanirhabdus sp. W0125-5]WBW94821.1 translation elongation factor Ts [Oceanirhabdus sp. W0125-5]